MCLTGFSVKHGLLNEQTSTYDNFSSAKYTKPSLVVPGFYPQHNSRTYGRAMELILTHPFNISYGWKAGCSIKATTSRMSTTFSNKCHGLKVKIDPGMPESKGAYADDFAMDTAQALNKRFS